MWIQTQKGDEILEVNHIRLLPLEDGTVNILAKLERGTVLLGNYKKDRAEFVVEDLRDSINRMKITHEMPKK